MWIFDVWIKHKEINENIIEQQNIYHEIIPEIR